MTAVQKEGPGCHSEGIWLAAGGLIDKDPPAIPVTAPVRVPTHLTLDVSTVTAHSHPHCMYRHAQRDREKRQNS